MNKIMLIYPLDNITNYPANISANCSINSIEIESTPKHYKDSQLNCDKAVESNNNKYIC